MGRTLFKLSAVLAAFAVAAFAFADEAFDEYASDVNLLMNKQVQKTLNVQEIQRTKLNKHADWFNAESAKIAKATTQANMAAQNKKMDDLLSTFKKKIMTELSKWQKQRLREISLQAAGPLALMDDRIAGKIGLTQAQVKKLRDAYTANQNASAKINKDALEPIYKKYAAKTPKTDAEKKKLTDEMQKELDAAAKKVAPKLKKLADDFMKLIDTTMTETQEKNYKALLGTPYKPA